MTQRGNGDAIGWGTALQAGRSLVRFPMVSLEFDIDIIFPAAQMALTLTQSLTEMITRNIFWGGWRWPVRGMTTLPPSCAECLEIWEPQHPGTLRACPDVYRNCFTVYRKEQVRFPLMYPQWRPARSFQTRHSQLVIKQTSDISSCRSYRRRSPPRHTAVKFVQQTGPNPTHKEQRSLG